jgi:hypothetical protein
MMLPLHIVITVDPLGNLCAEIGHGKLALEWILMDVPCIYVAR